MENLMSHLDYEDLIDLPSISDIEFRIKSGKHRLFVKQLLELWMFVPCDKDGNILEEPIGGIEAYSKTYQQAKERCLFEGYEYFRKWFGSDIIAKDKITGYGQIDISEFHTIEDLINYDLKLTPAALIQFT